MSKTLSLESYLREVEKKKKEGSVLSDEKAGSVYQSALTAGLDKAQKLVPTYGKNAKKLGKSGLVSSGYRDYLQSKSDGAATIAESSAFGKYLANLSMKEEGTSPAETAGQSAKTSAAVFSVIRATQSVNYNFAYRYAKMQGLDDELAKETAQVAIAQNESDYITKTLVAAVKNHSARANTLAVAYAKGVSDEGLNTINDFYNKYTGDTKTLSEMKDLYERLSKKK
ncbi:MAG: hypothetical protein MJ082_05135 [Clostridia bacterium]|nr:hypothetical protein [Clostridia bacterium]